MITRSRTTTLQNVTSWAMSPFWDQPLPRAMIPTSVLGESSGITGGKTQQKHLAQSNGTGSMELLTFQELTNALKKQSDKQPAY
jgi:hypothetical protein